MNFLYEFMFSYLNINKYRGLLISFNALTPLEIHNANLLNMTQLDDGIYYYQFE